jgi:signal transduction histidine kinase
LESAADKQYPLLQPATFLAASAVVLGLMGFSGWLLNSVTLRSFLSDGATMKVNTALIIICCGVSILLFNASKHKAASLLLLIPSVICIVTLLEYATNSQWGVDQLIFKDSYTNALLETPGRPSVLTLLNGLLVCTAIYSGFTGRYKISQSIATLSFFIIYTALIGHLFGISNFYRWGRYSGIAFHTALSFALLNLSVLFLSSNKGWLAVLFIKVRGSLTVNYFVAYLLFLLPILIYLYIYIISKSNITATSAAILIIIIGAVIVMPVFYLFLSQINTIDADLRWAKKRLEIALSAGKFGSYDVDLASGLMACTDQCKINFGLLPGSTFNFPDLMNAIVPQHCDYVNNQVQNAIAEHKLYVAEYQVEWPDGSLHWINASGMPQYDDNGRAISIIGVTYDITEKKENDLRKNAFIGMVSHELKTPLTSLKAYVQVLNKRAVKKNEEFEISALAKVEHQVIKMTKMINGFLNVSRLESGQIYLDKTRFNLGQLIQETVEETTLTLPTHKINLNLPASIMIEADRDKIGQVLNNLIANAVKYSPNERVIDIDCSVNGNAAIINVKDKGMGIAPKYFGQLFDRFYRVENVNQQHISGFGIGLYLSAEIVRLHGGKITVESEEGKGSVFSFTLPGVV